MAPGAKARSKMSPGETGGLRASASWPLSSANITQRGAWRDVLLDLQRACTAAAARIRPYVRLTPLEASPALSALGGDKVYLKAENLQATGSFKVRGAFNKLLTLAPAELERGVVAASSGNHGAAVAFAVQQLGARSVIFVPEHAAKSKVAAIRRLGAEIRVYGNDSVLAERAAREYADQSGCVYISPYNDWEVIAGQGVIGLEIARAQPAIQTLYVTVGGGGLASGIAAFFKGNPGVRKRRPVRIVGCLPANSPVMLASVRAGGVVEMESLPTLADGSAGGIEADAVTFGLCQQLIDDWIVVEEDEIAAAIRLLIETHHYLVEGAAGVAVAAYLKDPQRGQGRNVAIVLCGANLDLEVLRGVLCGRPFPEAPEPPGKV